MSVYKHDLDFRTMKGTLKQIHKSIQNLKLQCCEPSVPRVYPINININRVMWKQLIITK